MKAKVEAIRQFSRTPLKHPMSKFLLHFIAESKSLLERISFVRNREYLSNTMLISELGSPRVGFELELGARQREEVSIVNGQLVRQTRRDCSLSVTDPLEAIEPLRTFKGRLYVVFSFSGPTPSWYEAIVEPNPALPLRPDAQEHIDRVMHEIVRDQVDLAILAIVLRQRIDEALRERDKKAFSELAPVYRELVERCLWTFD